jgi:hypothetical protein
MPPVPSLERAAFLCPEKETHMSSLIPFGSSTGLSPRVERQLSREVAHIQARGVVLAAREVTAVNVIEEVTETALLATTRLARLETALALEVPNATGWPGSCWPRRCCRSASSRWS